MGTEDLPLGILQDGAEVLRQMRQSHLGRIPLLNEDATAQFTLVATGDQTVYAVEPPLLPLLGLSLPTRFSLDHQYDR